MKSVGNWLAWILVAAIGTLAALNWSTLVTPAPIDLLLLRIDAPLGLVLAGMVALLAGVLLVVTLRNQIRSLLETRRLLKEIQRVQAVADQAEASRVGELQRFLEVEFRRLHGRLDTSAAGQPALAVDEI